VALASLATIDAGSNLTENLPEDHCLPSYNPIHTESSINDKTTSLRRLRRPKSPLYRPTALSELHEDGVQMLLRETAKKVRAERAASVDEGSGS
jgi:hypothetical protein